MFDRSPAAFKPRLFQGFGSTVLVAASLFCGAAQASVTATLVQNSASTSSGVLTGTGALLNALTAPQFDISTGINGGVSTGATFTSESNLTGSLITFRNGLISSGTNSSSTVGVAITFTNDQTFSYRPTLHSTLLAAGIGIGMSSIRLGGTNDPATTTLECTMTQLKNCGTYTPTQGYGPYSLGDFGTAKAGFDFDVSVAGASIYNLTGEMQNTGNTISQSFTRVANGISTTSANGGDFLSGYTADRNDATGRAFSWGDTGVDITLPDLLAPGQSVTAIYTITTVANGGTGGVTLFPGGRITGINSLAFSSFGDPVGGGSTISNDGLPGGTSSTGGISTSGYSIFALPTEMVDAVHQTVTANFSGHTTSVANDHPYDSPTAGPAAAPVPEPAMLGLFGLGAASVIGARFGGNRVRRSAPRRIRLRRRGLGRGLIERLASAPPGELMPGRRFSVGLTGHRLDRLGAENVARVAAGVAAVLETVESAAPGLAPIDLRLVTGMADGADSIAADAALARGWTLDAALPFARDDFAADFAPGEHRDAYWRRLSSCGAVMELPGDRNSEDGEGAAYERAGHVVLAQSDILVAVWDGEAARGRGGAAEIVSEAVLRGIPVIHLPSADDRPPQLLWQGLEELDLGQQTRETVARGDLGALPRLIRDILEPPADATSRAMILRFETARTRRWTLAIPYPLLLAVMGVRRMRLSDIFDRGDSDASAPIREICASGDAFAGRVHDLLAPRFAHADTWATRSAQRFRSLYVSNFALAAIAVVLSLTGLALPPGAKPLLITLELSTIAAILFQTRAGNRAAWHRLWLDNRALAERLRCLAISTQLGDLDLRAGGPRTPFWVAWYMHATARELGLPSVRIDSAYLTCVRTDLTTLIDGQVAYLNADARRMHHLEHRLHGLGTILFAMTAFACVSVLAFKAISTMLPGLDGLSHPVTIGATIVGAALPAIGAAIYGIRMQGDFAGIAGRSHALAAQLATLRGVIAEDDLGFDTLIRRVRRVTGLLTEDLASWLQTYDARPLVLPG